MPHIAQVNVDRLRRLKDEINGAPANRPVTDLSVTVNGSGWESAAAPERWAANNADGA